MSARDNYYASFRGIPLAAKPVGRGRLEGSLGAMAVYCLRSCHRRVGRINDARLAELYLKQCPGLLSPPDPRFMRVRLKPFRAWLLRNIDRISMTKSDLREEESRRFQDLARDYADNGPHFHNPDHRRAWEEAQAH
ncbi:MAG TPA: hypothetical protein VNA68_01085 [Candidatus Dormibacteraeota bacterium]|nr:hypothetical protein [Candidatus Dormibacteraeota bacterium]